MKSSGEKFWRRICIQLSIDFWFCLLFRVLASIILHVYMTTSSSVVDIEILSYFDMITLVLVFVLLLLLLLLLLMIL